VINIVRIMNESYVSSGKVLSSWESISTHSKS
jgi:hypothetical protein